MVDQMYPQRSYEKPERRTKLIKMIFTRDRSMRET